MRPVTPQPPQGGGSGFPAILSLLILHRHLRHDIIYQTITLNTVNIPPRATALFINVPSPVGVANFIHIHEPTHYPLYLGKS